MLAHGYFNYCKLFEQIICTVMCSPGFRQMKHQWTFNLKSLSRESLHHLALIFLFILQAQSFCSMSRRFSLTFPGTAEGSLFLLIHPCPRQNFITSLASSISITSCVWGWGQPLRLILRRHRRYSHSSSQKVYHPVALRKTWQSSQPNSNAISSIAFHLQMRLTLLTFKAKSVLMQFLFSVYKDI